MSDPYSRISSRSTTRGSTREAWSDNSSEPSNRSYSQYNNVFGNFSVLVHDALSSNGTQSVSSSTTTLNEDVDGVTETTEVEQLHYPGVPKNIGSDRTGSAVSSLQSTLNASSINIVPRSSQNVSKRLLSQGGNMKSTPESGVFTERSGYTYSSNETPISTPDQTPIIPLQEIRPGTSRIDQRSTQSIDAITIKEQEVDEESPTSSPTCCNTLRLKTYKPYSDFVFYWLSVVSLAVLYNMWSIPIRAAFKSEVHTPYQYVWWSLDAVCDLIYAVDAVIKFRTEIFVNGMYHTDLEKLNSLHVRDWSTLLDVLSVIPTDFFYLINENPLLRLNRILRFYRMTRFSVSVESRLHQRFSYFWRFFASCHAPLLLFHCNACLYYSLSAVRGFGSLTTSWAFPDPVTNGNYGTLQMKYTFSFYRSLQLMNFIGGQSSPEEEWQFSYSVVCVVLGMATMAFFIGNAIKDIINSNASKLKFETDMESTRAFLRENAVPITMQNQFEEFYKHVWSRSDFSGMKSDIAANKYLPATLAHEIDSARDFSALKQIKSIEFDEKLDQNNHSKSLTRNSYLPQQIIKQKNGSDAIGFVTGGQVNIIRGDDDDHIHTLYTGDILEYASADLSDPQESVRYISDQFTEILFFDKDVVHHVKHD